MRILLIAGGWSSERDVSLSGAKGIEKAIAALGHEVTVYDPATTLDGLLDMAKEHDFAFINLHGSPGEDGLVQAMLETIGCPYQGAGPRASFLALNKAASKQIFRNHGLQTPDWVHLTAKPESGWQPELQYPLFAKANNGGSSLALSYIATPEKLDETLNALFLQTNEVIIESAIEGVEVTCGILDNDALPPVLIRPAETSGFFDYEAKYTPGAAEEICPAPLPEEITRKAQEVALAAHNALGLYGYSRADFILTADNSLHLLEVNTLPGMTPNSLLPQEANAVGYSFDELIAKLIELGLTRNRR